MDSMSGERGHSTAYESTFEVMGVRMGRGKFPFQAEEVFFTPDLLQQHNIMLLSAQKLSDHGVALPTVLAEVTDTPAVEGEDSEPDGVAVSHGYRNK